MEAKTQGHVVAVLNSNITDATKFFLRWRKVYERKTEENQMRRRGAQVLWKKMSKEALIEKQRSFKIWRDTNTKFN
jgi:hypothetical protein